MDHPHTAAHLEFLIFNLGVEEYGIPLQQVQELRASERVTQMAGAPDFLLGVSNLRGVIVPIVDLRRCLGMSASARGPGSVSVILQRDGAMCGLVVDGVSEVVTLAATQIRPAPCGSDGLAERHLLGIGTLEQRLLILIDLAELLAEIGMMPSMALAA